MKTYRIAKKYYTIKLRMKQSLLLEDALLKLGFDNTQLMRDLYNKGLNDEQISELMLKLMQSTLKLEDQLNILSIILTPLNFFYRLPKIGDKLFYRFYTFNENQVEINKKNLVHATSAEVMEPMQDFFLGFLGGYILSSAFLNGSKPQSTAPKINHETNSEEQNTIETSLVTPII